MSAPAELLTASPTVREAGLWSGAAALIVSAHLAIGYAFHTLTPAPPPPEAQEALSVDLTPFVMTMAESVESETVAEEMPDKVAELPEEVTEELVEAEPERAVEQDTVDPVEPLEPDTPPEVVEAPEPVDTPELVEEVMEEAPASEVVLPQPEKVQEEEPKKPEPKRKTQTKKIAKAEPTPRKKTAEATGKPAPKADASTKAVASTARSVSPVRWNSQVYAAIARRKPRGDRGRGSVTVRFVVNSSGSVVSASVAASSGDPSLDRTALNMVHSARIPAPPPELRGSHPFTIPVTFR